MAGSGAVFGVKTVRARGQECFAIEMTREFVKGRRYTHRVGAATEGNRDQSRHWIPAPRIDLRPVIGLPRMIVEKHYLGGFKRYTFGVWIGRATTF